MSAAQNIYDNPVFFDGYRKLRENPDSANILLEKPALFELSPDLTGKIVLDLGCGYGKNCAEFYRRGAKSVVGVDISEKMLEVAKSENHGIRFERLDMNDLSALKGKFDVIFSSLAAHYIEDFDKFAEAVSGSLNSGGYFIFSQEHPLTTAPVKGASWAKDADGNADHYILTDYGNTGERNTSWIVDSVIKYHRTFSEILNALINAGLAIEKLIEPIPSREIISRLPGYAKDLHKPSFLLARARKY
ncbi:MAG: class I SAM-dependent methyltransferase [Oscillospiraceae bacterium]|jgi:SAM-dependent methyltransferase|nr:class I SAM-dependent methyltransferase [Oscillospiraceae bacterium]